MRDGIKPCTYEGKGSAHVHLLSMLHGTNREDHQWYYRKNPPLEARMGLLARDSFYIVWQYGLWSFQTVYTKLERINILKEKF